MDPTGINDPFAQLDEQRTFIKPNPGGRTGPQRAYEPPRDAVPDPGARGLRREVAHTLGQRIAQGHRVGDMAGRAKLRDHQQQAIGQRDQGVQPDVGRRQIGHRIAGRL